MSYSHGRRLILNDVSAEQNSKALSNPETTFRVVYWNIACIAATARDMFAYGKATWIDETHEKTPDWCDKIPSPYKVLPVLSVIAPNGKELVLSESIVIDQYLAKKFNLLGDNEWEEWAIKTHYSNIHYLRERSLMKMTWTWADKRKEALEVFLEETLPDFIVNHEFHLKGNGSNGHYVGDRLSLADIHLVNVMDHFTQLPNGERFTVQFEKSELLTKVRQNVEKNIDIAAWRASKEWERFHQGSIETYAVTRPPPSTNSD
ncbi:Glutathione S-transferase S1 [Linnemannia gamsii]|uniref:Glutathione S-transferase S1 n=1 Tax=Linnemannia gamsii TaxID=64522 RepID=A0ABQ7K7R2_9FUNG|nr:Glutathione S-transferase S1 [Linnemannia gamsii]